MAEGFGGPFRSRAEGSGGTAVAVDICKHLCGLANQVGAVVPGTTAPDSDSSLEDFIGPGA